MLTLGLSRKQYKLFRVKQRKEWKKHTLEMKVTLVEKLLSERQCDQTAKMY